MRGGLRRSWRQRLLIGFNSAVILSALTTAWALQGAQARAEDLARVELPGSLRTPEQQAPAGDRVLNILLVGSDSAVGLDPDDPINNFRQGENFSDVIIILHVDEAAGTVAMFSIPRDLWVPIAESGETAKINSAFAWGGPSRLIETIKLNMDVEIDYYLNVNFAGFRDLVDVVGGVDVYFPAAARDWDTAYNITRTGFEVDSAGCHYLEPDQALAYVRSRHYQTLGDDGEWIEDTEGDIGRIVRQQDFVQRLVAEAISQGARNPFKLRELVDRSLASVTVDDRLTAQVIIDLATNLRSFEADELATYAYPVEFAMIERQSVVLGQEAEAEAMLALLRGAQPSDPETVFVEVSYDGSVEDSALAMIDGLTDDGFLLADPEYASSEGGVLIEHGPDGEQAAQLVFDSLVANGTDPASMSVAYSDKLEGRTVAVSVGSNDSDATNTGDEEVTTTTRAGTTTSANPASSSPPTNSLSC